MSIWLWNLAQVGLLIVLAPAVTALVRKFKARLQNRRGPGLLQPYRDLAKLFSKQVLLANNASWLFRLAPYVIFAATVLAAAIIPVFLVPTPFTKTADVIALVEGLKIAFAFQ